MNILKSSPLYSTSTPNTAHLKMSVSTAHPANNVTSEHIMPASMAPKTEAPFPLLKLPPELRLMVYEFISVDVHAEKFDPYKDGYKECQFTMVTTFIYPSILATCRQINVEAEAIMKKKFDEIMNIPLRLIVGIDNFKCEAHKCSAVRILPYTRYPTWGSQPWRHLQTCDSASLRKAATETKEPESKPSQAIFVALMHRWQLILNKQRGWKLSGLYEEPMKVVEIGVRLPPFPYFWPPNVRVKWSKF